MLMNKDKILLALVDDHPIVIHGIVSLLTKQEEISVTGTFNNGEDFLSFLKENKPDIVLLDIMLPDTNGIDLCKQIKAISPGIRILALSNHTERSLIMQMLQNGASGYILKNA